MKRMLKFVLCALLASTVLLAATTDVQAQGVLERAKRDGYIRVGFPNQVPYAYANEKGQLTGADAAVAKLDVEKMGIARVDCMEASDRSPR